MIYHNRKLNRCQDWDYSSPGYYFVTICVQDKKWIMASLVDGHMIKNGLGLAIANVWEKLPNHYKNCYLDEYVFMPDHFHGILRLVDSNKRYTLSEIVRGFKTFSSREINRVMFGGFKWQKSFHDRIIRSQIELNKIREYIRNNPDKLEEIYKNERR
jgi:putative transposase